ncbi:UNVERIFIED_CONTAM: hypothetical protein FKN15_049267 [Acipenser sinensis]
MATTVLLMEMQGKGRLRRSSYHTPSSPVGTRLPSVSDVPEESAGEEAGVEVELSEQQQVAMQQEERVLTEQIESLQKEKEELTFEMLALEPRASDDETLESEASIGTADSSENLNVDSEGATSDMSGFSPGIFHNVVVGGSADWGGDGDTVKETERERGRWRRWRHGERNGDPRNRLQARQDKLYTRLHTKL